MKRGREKREGEGGRERRGKTDGQTKGKKGSKVAAVIKAFSQKTAPQG